MRSRALCAVPGRLPDGHRSRQRGGGGLCQKTFFPIDSILADYRDYAITQTEASDTYIMGLATMSGCRSEVVLCGGGKIRACESPETGFVYHLHT